MKIVSANFRHHLAFSCLLSSKVYTFNNTLTAERYRVAQLNATFLAYKSSKRLNQFAICLFLN